MEQTISINNFEDVLNESFTGLVEMIDTYMNGDDADRYLIDLVHGRE